MFDFTEISISHQYFIQWDRENVWFIETPAACFTLKMDQRPK